MLRTINNPNRPGLAEPNFRRFEQVLDSALRVWPATFVVIPTEMKCTTFVARLRDAIAGLLQHRYDTFIDVGMLRSVRSDLAVWHDATSVFIGHKENALASATVSSVHVEYLIKLETITPAQLEALATFYALGLSDKPSLIKSIPSQINPLPAGVVLERQADDTYIML